MMPMHLDVLWLAAISLLGLLIIGGVIVDLVHSRFQSLLSYWLHCMGLGAVVYLWAVFMCSFIEYLKTGV